MARAAEQEHIEPSAISKRIAQLEDDLGVELLVRGRRGVQPTPAGLALLEHARSVLFTMDRIVADAASFAGGVQGHVRLIATASAIAEALLDDIAVVHARARQRQHQGRHRGARLARPRARGARRQRLARRVLGPRRLRGPGASPYRRDRLVLAVYAGHPLAGRASVRFEETLDFEHVGLPPTTAVHTMLQRAAAQRRANGRRTASSSPSFDAALRVVAANLGVSVVPLEVGRRAAVGADIALVPIADAWAERRFAICFRDFDALPPASRRLVDHLQARAAACA